MKNLDKSFEKFKVDINNMTDVEFLKMFGVNSWDELFVANNKNKFAEYSWQHCRLCSPNNKEECKKCWKEWLFAIKTEED